MYPFCLLYYLDHQGINMKLKRIYEYLGAGDPDLNDKATARCPSCCPPDLPVVVHEITAGTKTIVSPTSRRQPEAIKINDNMFFLMYTEGSNSVLYYRVITVNSDLTLSMTAEATLLSGGGSSALQHFHGAYLQDNKIIIVYVYNPPSATTFKARIVNFSGTTPTFGATVDLNTEATGGLPNAPCRVARLNSGKAILAFTNSDNLKPTLQVIDISVSDVITFGVTYKDTATNRSHPRLAVIGETLKGVLGTSHATVNVQGLLSSFSISGTVVTWGTALAISNLSQLPGSSNRQLFFADISAASSGGIQGIGGSAVDSVRSHLIMPITHGIPTTVTPEALQDTTTTDYANDPTSTQAAILHRTTHTVAAIDLVRTSLRDLALRLYNTGTPPVLQDSLVIESHATQVAQYPELLYLSGRTSICIYHYTLDDTIRCYPFRSV